ncbi:helix-hairpin-helix domain-containing protein [Haloplanus halobius]|uniref:helix-hairpin-helix domain-containing protein n=1 Tax=Haloplanus halobius TaxID=2934938 RepID=UPI00200D9B9D|nr:helix-hairpin-helix domain-containing protein [Haloplanus sp. XH21]
MKNEDVAQLLFEIADLLEMQDVEYKPRAYRQAARNVQSLSADIEAIHERGELDDIDGVGESIASKIAEYLETGELDYLQQLRGDLDLDIEALTAVRGVGPKTARTLYREAGITDLEDLEQAAREGRIGEIEGFGAQTEANILDHIERAKRGQERTLIGRAFSRAEELHDRLDDAEAFDRVQIVGSFRRRRPTVGDIDILATASDAEAAMETFCGFEDVAEVRSRGETKSSITVPPDDLQVDLRVVEDRSWGAALVYFTGSKDHNITLRDRALDRDWKLNEYGLFDVSDVKDEGGKRAGEVLASETEEAVYDALGLAWIPPELREDTGEVAAAAEGRLPALVETDELRGDLQVHTDYSDGSHTVREMAQAADDRGLEYVVITDHGPETVAGGVDGDALADQQADIAAVNDDDAIDVTVLHGVEANVTADGLDIDDDWLERLDLVVAGVHTPPDDPTDRLVEAVESAPIDVLAHPTNRLLMERGGIDYDLDRVVDAAAANDVALEINAQPERLDLDWRAVKRHRDAVDFVVSTDAHATEELDYLHLGVAQARRGWCEASDVLNTEPLDTLPIDG